MAITILSYYKKYADTWRKQVLLAKLHIPTAYMVSTAVKSYQHDHGCYMRHPILILYSNLHNLVPP